MSDPALTVPGDDDLLGFFMAIGYVAHVFAQIEQNLDMWIAVIYHSLGARATIDQRIPTAFKRKTKFLKRAFRGIDHLRQFADEALPLLAEANELSNRRNDLIHGVQTGARTPEGGWQMVIFDYEKDATDTDWHHARDFHFSPADFKVLEARLIKLSGSVVRFGLKLVDSTRPSPGGPEHAVL